MAKKFFHNKKIINQIKEQIQILDVAKENGLTPVKKGEYYSLKEHDSVVIYPQSNSFFRHATSQGGDVFAFAEEFNIASFHDFYMKYLNKIDKTIDPLVKNQNKTKSVMERKDLRFDINESLEKSKEREKKLLSEIKFDNNNRNVKAFLIQTRKIDSEIVDEFISKGLIKQAIDKYNHKLCVFIGYNDVGLIAAINLKSTNSRGGFKGDAINCNYAFGWRYDPDINDYKNLYRTEFFNSNKTLICFEGYIDMLAYISTLKEAGINYKQFAYITCGATSKYKSVVATCKSNLYNHVICAFDNDEAGNIHAAKLHELLKEECHEDIIVERQTSMMKDWDEDRQYFFNTHDRRIYSHVIEKKEIKKNPSKKSIAKMTQIAKNTRNLEVLQQDKNKKTELIR